MSACFSILRTEVYTQFVTSLKRASLAKHLLWKQVSIKPGIIPKNLSSIIIIICIKIVFVLEVMHNNIRIWSTNKLSYKTNFIINQPRYAMRDHLSFVTVSSRQSRHYIYIYIGTVFQIILGHVKLIRNLLNVKSSYSI